MNLQAIYDSSPYWAQTLFLNAYAFGLKRRRQGHQFDSQLHEFLAREWQTEQQLIAFQEARLRLVITNAYNHVPYYRTVMNRLGLEPADISTLADLRKLPILEKSDVRTHAEDLKSRDLVNRHCTVGRTSGTTGSPLAVLWDREMQVINHVVDWRQKIAAGIQPGTPIAFLLGRPIVSLERTSPPFWQHNRVDNHLWMSAFHLNQNNLSDYVDKLLLFQPVAIEGYPSTVLELAKYLVKNHLAIPSVTAVLTSSEPLLADHRELIEAAFRARVYNFYGHAERAVFATQCSEHRGQHINMDYGIVELIDEDNEPSLPGSAGEIVATGLWNMAMPLIRYRVGDTTAYLPGACKCGRQMPLMSEVETKKEDRIIRQDGTVISASVLTHPFKPILSIEKSQIIQTGIRNIEIHIVRRPEYTQSDEAHLLAEFRRRVGQQFTVNIRYVQDIPRTGAGKFRWVINQSKRPLDATQQN